MKKIMITLGLAFAFAAPTFAAVAHPSHSTSSKRLSPPVRDVAAHPSAYLGRLTLTGVVGIVSPGKGFVLVDMKEYREEGFNCLATREPTKISVRWKGAAPKVREKVRVEGQLAKKKAGYAFTAKKVRKQ